MQLPIVREEYGFQRTRCGCPFCKVYCRHMPGTLSPSDLPRLCPEGRDVFAWAEQHLRARDGQPYPALVPARGADGTCHWYFDGGCAVHENAPFGCAFFDAHMPDGEVERRAEAAVRACTADAAEDGLYYRVWLHLRNKGLTARQGDKAAVVREAARLSRRAAGFRRRTQPAPIAGPKAPDLLG